MQGRAGKEEVRKRGKKAREKDLIQRKNRKCNGEKPQGDCHDHPAQKKYSGSGRGRRAPVASKECRIEISEQ